MAIGHYWNELLFCLSIQLRREERFCFCSHNLLLYLYLQFKKTLSNTKNSHPGVFCKTFTIFMQFNQSVFVRIVVEFRRSQILSVTKMYNGTLRGTEKIKSKKIRQKDRKN